MTKMMTHVLALSTALAGFSSWTAPTAKAGETLDRILKKKTLVQVVSQTFPPFSLVDGNGEMTGLDVDIAKAFAKKLGVELRVETPAWAITTAGNWKGRWDICICSMTPTPERGKVLRFINEYYSVPVSIVVNKNNTSIKAAADLSNKRAGIQAGETYEKYLNKQLTIEVPGRPPLTPAYPFTNAVPVPYDSVDTAFQDLELGDGLRLDAVVTNFVAANRRIERTQGKLRLVGDDLYSEPVMVAVEKGDPEWEAKIREIFKQLYDDGTLKALSVKWVGRDIIVAQ